MTRNLVLLYKEKNIVTVLNTVTKEVKNLEVDLDRYDIHFNRFKSNFEEVGADEVFAKYNEEDCVRWGYEIILPMQYIGTEAEEVAFRINVARFLTGELEEPDYLILRALRNMGPYNGDYMYPEEKEALRAIFLA